MKKWLKIVLISIPSLLVAVVVAVLLLLNPVIIPAVVDKLVGENVNADFSYSKIKVKFPLPCVRLAADSLVLTCPEEKFGDLYDNLPSLAAAGRGSKGVDTLAFVSHLDARVNVFSLLRKRPTVKVPELRLEGFGAYPFVFEKGRSNTDVFAFSKKPKDTLKDSTAFSLSSLPSFRIDSIVFDRGRLRYASVPDSLAVALDLEHLGLSLRSETDGDTLNIESAQLDLRALASSLSEGVLLASTAITADASAHGTYSEGVLPDAEVCLRLSDVGAEYYPLDLRAQMLLDVDASLSDGNKLRADIHEFKASTQGLDVEFGGYGDDLLGDDPLYSVNADAKASLDELSSLVARFVDVGELGGDLHLNVDARTRWSELSAYKFNEAHIAGELDSRNVTLKMPSDSLSAELFNTAVSLNSHPEGFKLNIDFDSLYFNQGVFLIARIRNIRNEASISKIEKDGQSVPKLLVTSDSDRIFAKVGSSRYGVRGLNIAASATRKVRRRDPRRERLLDSLQAANPGVSRRELILRYRLERMEGRELPDFLKEKDFEKGDIDISLDSTYTKVLRDWAPAGHFKADGGFYASPVLPLRTRLTALHADFDDNAIELDTLGVVSGSSDLGVTGHITGIGRALLHKGMLESHVDLYSNRLNINEFVAALEKGSRDIGDVAPDDEFDESFVTDTLENAKIQTDTLPLIIVPANLKLAVHANVGQIDYADFVISPFHSAIRMQERTLQLTDTRLSSNFGDINLDAFYSTKNKQDISCGVDLRLSEMPAHDIISLIPTIDDMLPALRSFDGRLGCEVSATTQLDTNMNFIIPTLDALVRIKGENLEIKDAGDLRKITRLLLFKNKNIGHIDNLQVDALVHDSKVEIFPFELGVDRYRLALRGTQALSGDMHYHASILKSPFLIRFGVDIYGTPDNWRFSLGRARYREGKMPSLTTRIDTVQINLAHSIKDIFSRGVDNVMRHNEQTLKDFDIDKGTPGEGSGELLSMEEYTEIENLSIEAELEEQSAELEKEAQELLDATLLDPATVMKEYEESIYDRKMERKIERMKKKAYRRAMRDLKKL